MMIVTAKHPELFFGDEAPQFGHVLAVVLSSFPQYLHVVIAIGFNMLP